MKKILFFLLTIGCFNGQAQFKELHFNHLTNKNGLPSELTSAILQDGQGYIWLGTMDGPVRFDGYNAKLYALGAAGGYTGSHTVQIFEDAWHRLWAGSYGNGLFLYDRGMDEFIQYATSVNNHHLLSANNIESITADTFGGLWVTTTYSQARFLDYIDTKKHTAQHFNCTPGKNNSVKGGINTVFADHAGNAWVGTDSGVYLLKRGAASFKPFAEPQTAEGCRLFFEEPGEPGIIWMATGDYLTHPATAQSFIGVARYNTRDGRWQYFKHSGSDSKSIASDTVGAINADKNGNIWLATPKGLSVYAAVSQTFSNYAPLGVQKLSNDGFYGQYGPRSLVLTKDNNFWYSVDYTLYYFNTTVRKFYHYPTYENEPDGLPPSDPRQILVGSDNNLWACIAGLHWLNSRRSSIIRYQQGDTNRHKLPIGEVTSFANAANGNTWIYGPAGIYQWHPETDAFTKDNTLAGMLKGKYVEAVVASGKGKLWIAAYPSVFICYDTLRHTAKRFTYNPNDSNSLPDSRIDVLFEDREGVVWVGTYRKGICSYNPLTNKFTRYRLTGSDYDPVYVIYEDREGAIWAVSNNGLWCLSRSARHFAPFETDFHDFRDVTAIREDSQGRFWLGTASAGVFVINKDKRIVSHLTTKSGLASDEIYDIAEDPLHRYWLLSPPGFNIINTNSLAPAKLTVKNGFPDVSFLLAPLIFNTGKSLFLVNCQDGFVAFNPLDIQTDTVAPIVHIGEIGFSNPFSKKTVDSVLLRWGKTAVRLAYNQNRITFTYTGLQYQFPELTTYMCRLDGFDKDWQFNGVQRFVTYNNLSPGTYMFHVKAANSDGFWSKGEDQLTVIIAAPWWQTWWAYAMYVLAAGSLVWAFVYYRSKKLFLDNRILEHKIKVRTAEVLEQKEEIAAQRDNLEKTLQELQATQKQLIQSEKMASLGELTAGIAHEIQNPLNFVNNFSEVNQEMLVELHEELNKGNINEAKAITTDIQQNEEKISHHGKRADAIVKGMLQHSRSNTGKKEPTDINVLADEYLRLSYNGLRAKDKSFNAETYTSLDDGIPKIEIVPQEIGRVLLNLCNNAFYAVNEKAKTAGNGYKPTVTVTTKQGGGQILITVSDNGNGIPGRIKDKIFQPFFTTKPTGQGTGLGLSLSYDIIKAHGGDIRAETKEGLGTEFSIQLPAKTN